MVYLVLAAQFESFIHPVVILVTVPLAITGALLGLWLFNSTINIFSQIGCIMLIGIACKNGILIVEFANQLRDRGVEFVDAVIQASATRLRPVLMTSLCTAFGAVPLMLAHGAGAESRESIGATVFFGTVVSLGMTLYVVPALYLLIARNTRSPEYMSRLIDGLIGGAYAAWCAHNGEQLHVGRRTEPGAQRHARCHVGGKATDALDITAAFQPPRRAGLSTADADRLSHLILIVNFSAASRPEEGSLVDLWPFVLPAA